MAVSVRCAERIWTPAKSVIAKKKKKPPPVVTTPKAVSKISLMLF